MEIYYSMSTIESTERSRTRNVCAHSEWV